MNVRKPRFESEYVTKGPCQFGPAQFQHLDVGWREDQIGAVPRLARTDGGKGRNDFMRAAAAFAGKVFGRFGARHKKGAFERLEVIAEMAAPDDRHGRLRADEFQAGPE